MGVSRLVAILVIATFGPVASIQDEEKCQNCRLKDCVISGERKGYCNIGCERGYHGNICDKLCPSTCSVCSKKFDTNGICYSCKDGFYLNSSKNCSGKCRSTCESCHSKIKCNKCKPGYFGSDCQRECRNCAHDCTKYSGKCIGDCKYGYYGEGCNIKCPDKCNVDLCYRYTGECQRCQSGWFGRKCEYKCEEKCEKCDEDLKECLICKQGFYGNECQSLCATGCAGKCDNKSGDCLADCVSGYYGSKCDLKCGDGCASGCERDTGRCVQPCKVGFFGNKCSQKCGEGCYGACVKDNGTCSLECLAGWGGSKCDQNCSQRCHGCTCERHTGNCLSGCNKGYYGPPLCKPCEAGCLDGLCDRQTGTCTNGCNKYWYKYIYGDFCNMTCSLLCDGGCHRKTGVCVNGCLLKSGHYGEYCNKTCPKFCSYPYVCSQITGNCTSKKNYACAGSSCQSSCVKCTSSGNCTSCKNGYFGNMCELNCPVGCRNDVCDITYGTCDQECKEGLLGKWCDVEKSSELGSSRKDMASIVGACVGSIFTLVVIEGVAYGIFRLVKRYKLKKAAAKEAIASKRKANNEYEHLRVYENARQCNSPGQYVNLQLHKL